MHLFLYLVDGINKLLDIELGVSVVYQILRMPQDFLSDGFANLSSMHQRTAGISAAVRGVFDFKLIHKWEKAILVIIIIGVLLTVLMMNQVVASGIIVPPLEKGIHFFGNWYFSDATLRFAGSYIKVAFFKVNIRFFQI